MKNNNFLFSIVPSGAPNFVQQIGEDQPFSVLLEIGDVLPQHENSVVIYYNISYTSNSWPDTLHSVNSTLIQHNDSNLMLWNKMRNVEVNCSLFMNITNPSSTSTHFFFNVSDLFPFTNYEFGVAACSNFGCSNQFAIGNYQTAPTFPSCSPNITMANTSSTSMLIKWEHLDYKCLHGTLQEYILMMFESHQNVDFNQTDFSYYDTLQVAKETTSSTETEVSDLKKYWNYTAVLFTKNDIGLSPPSIVSWGFTEEDSKWNI